MSKSLKLFIAAITATTILACEAPGQAFAASGASGATTAKTSTVATASTPPCTVSAKLVPSCGTLLGASTEKVGTQTWDQSVTAHEKVIGRKADVLHNYHQWNTAFPDAAESARAAAGQILLYSWIGQRQNGTVVSWADIAAGKEDATIDAEAARIAAMGRPVYVNFQNEPESSIGTSGTALQYAAAWRHIHDRFAAAGANNAVWTLVFMGVDSDNKHAEVKALYPGDAYVDTIAWDPYNWGSCRNEPWESFAQTVTPFYSWLIANGFGSKPFMLAEYGTVEDPSRPSAKADWFTDAGKALTAGQFPNLKMVSYFDHPAPPASCNWQLATSPAATSAYAAFASTLGKSTTTPVTAPGAPTAVTAVSASASATVGWTAPANTGGAAITGYQVTASPGGQSVTVAGPVTRAALAGLTSGATYAFTVTARNAAGLGAASVASAIVRAGASAVPASVNTAAGWQMNGTATIAGVGLQLTDATTKFSSGSAFFVSPIVAASSVAITFDAVSDGGTGADGLALAFADATAGAVPTSRGSSGGGLGWSGIPGYALALDTYANGTDPSSNFVGLATGFNPASVKDLVWKATSSQVPSLRALRHISVVISGNVMFVAVDGTQVLTASVALPGKTLIGFTAADGNRTDRHAVSNVVIKAI